MATLRLPLQFMSRRFRFPGQLSWPVFAIVLLAILAIGSTAGFLFANRFDRGDSYQRVYRGHLARLDANAAAGRVVFLGASTFQGLDVSRVTPFGLNLSVGAEPMADLIERAKTYRSVKSARVVVFNTGLNDLIRSCDGPLLAVDRLLSVVPSSTPVVVIGVQGISIKARPTRCKTSFPDLISQQNHHFKEACRRRSHCVYLQNPIPANVEQSVSDVLQEPDGIHLSGSGYAKLVSALTNALKQLADSPP